MFRPAPSPETRSVTGSSSHSRTVVPLQQASSCGGFLSRVLIEPPKETSQDAAPQRSSNQSPRKDSGNSDSSYVLNVDQLLMQRGYPTGRSKSRLSTTSVARHVSPSEQTATSGGFLSRILLGSSMENSQDAAPQRNISPSSRKKWEDSEYLSVLYDDRPLTNSDHPSGQSRSLVSALENRDQETRPRLSSSSCHSALAQTTKDECQKAGASMLETAENDWFIPRILKPDSDIQAPQDVMACRSADRALSPNARLSHSLNSEMRGNDLVYLDVKELAQDLKPNETEQASTSKAGTQHKDLKLNKGDQANVSKVMKSGPSPSHTEQYRSAARQLSSRGLQDEVVQAARMQTAHAHGLEHALDGDLRGLQQEFEELTRDLENVRAGLQNTPRMGFRNCFTPRM
eukprot:gnl/MRDRNA2_/MRDRNA2_113862_c0_seq1.p1 gnl/MRDRNA2_/MRDRNA2_113862_c0~~gnl/MRDRNA2_/MRDRNA2_113862_c0_seq1.p1  ORF type:complete len:401 (+),score=65.01 gnl/MRDRNA2_/MRDRNA2_113862_c0_seq1:95-1297(+)